MQSGDAGRSYSGWAAFAGVVMFIIGSLDAIWGLGGILNDDIVIVGGHGAIVADRHAGRHEVRALEAVLFDPQQVFVFVGVRQGARMDEICPVCPVRDAQSDHARSHRASSHGEAANVPSNGCPIPRPREGLPLSVESV